VVGETGICSIPTDICATFLGIFPRPTIKELMTVINPIANLSLSCRFGYTVCLVNLMISTVQISSTYFHLFECYFQCGQRFTSQSELIAHMDKESDDARREKESSRIGQELDLVFADCINAMEPFQPFIE
jgi:hypothetical protein